MSVAEGVDSVAERARRRRPAVVAAAGVGGWIVASAVLNTVFAFVSGLASSGLYDLQYLPWINVVGEVFLVALPVAAVFFLSVWWLSPVTGTQSLRVVITRSALAMGLGVLAQSVIGLVVGGMARILAERSLFGATFPLASIGDVSVWSVQSALSTFIGLLPLGVLAGVLLWIWLRSRGGEVPAAHSDAPGGVV
ncbi:hypothetical protein M2152_001400 [Microbacteriaceae bacterium SG_E_30_P1]|uniref:Uncharacterized protein n=1 Tax=Antiquaquibacter oligotrophicus TaxID=2880260 RepID=A0ABT6KMI4_9MICO|nr:hypothetical protein [Antiquaquibacter oligotrophicus]MDH6181218.1 hypothetical protein [Antiquaquibacter oligotrophicus]UDF13087.1 hypothetical protein LH407_13135 [Antiquaquibacter oligotrophicus]